MFIEVAGVIIFKPAILADGALSKNLSLSQIRITGDEYVVLRNTTNTNLQLNNYWLQYFNEFSLSTSGVSSSSTQLPNVTLQPNQEILLSGGVAANCGQIWVSKLPFTLKDSAGLLQVVALSQSSGIVGYKPEDQVAWSSKTSDAVDIKGVSSSSSAQIWYMSDSKWSATAAPPGCSVAGTSGGSSLPVLTLNMSNTSPPSLFLEQSDEDITATSIPSADAGLEAPQLSEIMPNPGSPKTDLNDEYVELYNPNDKAFDLNGFKLKTGTSSTTRYTFGSGQSLQPHEFKAFYSSQTNISLSNATSKVLLLSPDGDVLAESDTYSDAKDNYTWVYADGLWQWTPTATPNARNVIPSNTTTSSLSLGTSTSRPPSSILSKKYAALQISELLPHPQKPQTDADGEYIEIYNPGSSSVNLAGYMITSGIQDNHKFTIKSGVIGSKAYKEFYRPETNLTLSNTEGRVKLLAPDGSQLDITSNYPKAAAGQAWIFANGKWQWTSVPTPGKANILTVPAVLGAKSAKTNSTTARNVLPGASPGSDNNSFKTPLHPIVLAGIGAAALIYALYEYRHDLANLHYKLRRNRGARQALGR